MRAHYDARTIVVYQGVLTRQALRAKRFVAPFSFNRMTWIKPSFLWLMHRSNWARKSGQERHPTGPQDGGTCARRAGRESPEAAPAGACIPAARGRRETPAHRHVNKSPEFLLR
ncbi:DUF4291 family protein [Streptomyces sp. NPDC057580]|uniref:DUF4291 family protein n=1 Tax=Streptomyces sp. NPDC057580 TaxID=3346173 RepID=UPI0036C9E3E9